jgi:hypothetical protein
MIATASMATTLTRKSTPVWGRDVAQRIYGLALGYEDLNHHERRRSDLFLGSLSGERELG